MAANLCYSHWNPLLLHHTASEVLAQLGHRSARELLGDSYRDCGLIAVLALCESPVKRQSMVTLSRMNRSQRFFQKGSRNSLEFLPFWQVKAAREKESKRVVARGAECTEFSRFSMCARCSLHQSGAHSTALGRSRAHSLVTHIS